jgi:hypothetical protein
MRRRRLGFLKVRERSSYWLARAPVLGCLAAGALTEIVRRAAGVGADRGNEVISCFWCGPLAGECVNRQGCRPWGSSLRSKWEHFTLRRVTSRGVLQQKVEQSK